MRLRMEGFIILDFAADWAEGIKQLAVWVSEGKIKPRNTVVKGGLEAAPQALVDLFKGVNTGKKNPSVERDVDDGLTMFLGTGKLVVEVKEPSS